MARRSGERFSAIRTEGGLLPSDLLEQLLQRDAKLDGLNETAYHVVDVRLHEVITESWTRLVRVWATFQGAITGLGNSDPGTSVTRERWLLPLFHELGYGRLPATRPVEVSGKPYPVSHLWQHFPVHLIGWNVGLGERTPGVAGAAKVSPHGLVQELLSRSGAHLWGAVSNGRQLRLLRDNVSLTRQAYVEFDLEAMFRGELYSDFALLWLLLHQSRVEADRPEHCWLERWAQEAHRQGLSVLRRLREHVEKAIVTLGRGFLAHPRNERLRQSLRSGDLDPLGYYRQLLRMVYRLLFLFVAEDRDLLADPATDKAAKERYVTYYSTARFREIAGRVRGTSHGDLWQALRLVLVKLGADTGCPELGLPPLGSFLWSGEATPDLDGCELANRDLLASIRALAWTEEDRFRRPVDYRNLGPEELGSVYEALLELHPEINTEAPTFALTTASGHERKTTGSYYTPRSLIQALLDSALDPVLDEAARARNPEAAILSLKVCDPACGSGHFLIAASHRIARRLAAVRTGDDEPAPEALRHALRDVIGHCIHGVDVNEMAVELCKVALWMDALEPGKPLSFLDHRIVCGNSLLGTTPALIAHGIPDDAFEAIEGDDKKMASEWRKRNRREREGQMELPMVAEPGTPYGELGSGFVKLSAMGDQTIGELHERERRYRDLLTSSAYQRAHLLADAWCGAFVWRKTADAPPPVTEDVLRRIESDLRQVTVDTIAETERLARQYRFLHWHLTFPDVFPLPKQGEVPENRQAGWNGGFDVVLGNPPWEMEEVKEHEFFASSYPEILAVRSARDKAAILTRIRQNAPDLFARFEEHVRHTAAQAHLVAASGRFPLSAVGRLNLYRLFIEASCNALRGTGRAGLVVPSAFAFDAYSQRHFRNLHESGRLKSLYDFENAADLFVDVDSRQRFALLTVSGDDSAQQHADFVFFARQVEELSHPDRHIRLSTVDLARVNPITRTAPQFRSERDRTLAFRMHERAADVLAPEAHPGAWGVRPTLMFMMNAQMTKHRDADQLKRAGGVLRGNLFEANGELWLPLYEGKMVSTYDHRAAGIRFDPTNRVRRNQPDPLSAKQHEDPMCFPLPLFWVAAGDVRDRCGGSLPAWLPVVKDVTSATNERTCRAAILPSAALTDSVPWMRSTVSAARLLCLVANLNSVPLDFCARQKVVGMHLRGHYLAQLPTLSPQVYDEECLWSRQRGVHDWVTERALELSYTAWDLASFAEQCGYVGAPFRWREERRFLLRCELDAAFFHLYGIDRADVDYIMETFPIVKRADEKVYSEYRTKRVIVEIYDAMQTAIATGSPYQTILDPQPADPRVAHPGRADVQSAHREA